MNKKIFYGTIIIFYKRIEGELQFLIVKNAKTGTISFVSGAQEYEDKTLKDAAQREILEEINLSPQDYTLEKTDIMQEFIFGAQKKERAEHKGIYCVFVSDVTHLKQHIHPTKELQSVQWMTKENVMSALTFDDVKNVFQETLEIVK